MMRKDYYIGSFIISAVVAFVGILIYHSFINEPIIVFQEGFSTKNISFDKSVGSTNLPDFVTLAQKKVSSVIYINTIKSDENGMYRNTTGSGVLISPTGHIITNSHVVSDAEKITVTLYNNQNFIAKVIGKDASTDIAVLKINNPTSDFVQFGNSDFINVGEWIMLIGNPFRLRNSVSVGVVSAKNRTLNILGSNSFESYIQTDAMANPGNSGGAMFNKDGELVGMISAISTNSGSFQGYSFAIPSNIVKKVAFDIINYGVVQRAWLGVSIKNIEGEAGVVIERVNHKGAADICGLSVGDKIKKVEDVQIMNIAQFEEIISKYKPGDKIKIEFNRSGTRKNTVAELKNNLNTTDLIANRNDDILVNLGFVLRDLTASEKNEMGGFGVMVVSVIQGSTISSINIEPGYIIKTINGNKINDVNDFIIKYNQAAEKIQLTGMYKAYPGVFPYIFIKK